jgi:hypothetical protein
MFAALTVGGTMALGGTVAVGAAGAAASAEAQRKGGSQAAGAAAAAADQSEGFQREMNQQSAAEYRPFRNSGLSALPYYQSAILGGPVEYDDPNYQAIDSGELESLNNRYLQEGKDAAYFMGKDANFLNKHRALIPGSNLYDPLKKYYRAPDGSITTSVPKLSATYNHEESPAAKWLTQQGTQALNRSLASRGLSGSGQAATGLANLRTGILASDYDKNIVRMGNLVDIGRGAATNTAVATQNLGIGLSNLATGVGNANVDAINNASKARAGLYSGISGAVGNTVGVGTKLYGGA